MEINSAYQKRLFCDPEPVLDILVGRGVMTPYLPGFVPSFVLANNSVINSIYRDGRMFIHGYNI